MAGEPHEQMLVNEERISVSKLTFDDPMADTIYTVTLPDPLAPRHLDLIPEYVPAGATLIEVDESGDGDEWHFTFAVPR